MSVPPAESRQDVRLDLHAADQARDGGALRVGPKAARAAEAVRTGAHGDPGRVVRDAQRTRPDSEWPRRRGDGARAGGARVKGKGQGRHVCNTKRDFMSDLVGPLRRLVETRTNHGVKARPNQNECDVGRHTNLYPGRI